MAFIIDDIFLFPVKGIVWIAETLRSEAKLKMEKELHEELVSLEVSFINGKIQEGDYLDRERQILERIQSLKETEVEDVNSNERSYRKGKNRT